jgi:hypothetical protein
VNPTYAVCIAHPGHELLLHGWLRREQPLVFILTDGSGHTGKARLEESRCLLNSLGASLAAGSGRVTDNETYDLILEGRCELLTTSASELAAEILERGIRTVIADAPEGYNPVHDLSRMIAGAASELVAQAGGELAHYEFAMVNSQVSVPGTEELVHRLSDLQLEEKIAAGRSYASLRDEVNLLLRDGSTEPLRTEVMQRVPDWRQVPAGALQPVYELIGEQRVSAGQYQRVIRYSEHMAPLQRNLIAWLGACRTGSEKLLMQNRLPVNRVQSSQASILAADFLGNSPAVLP